MRKYTKWISRGLICGAIFALAFLLAQVSLVTTLAQRPSALPGGSVWFGSNLLWLAQYNGTSYVPFGPVFPYSEPSGSWSTDNGGTVDTTNGYPYYSADKSGVVSVRMAYQAPPAAPYTCWAHLFFDTSGVAPGTSPTYANVAVGLGIGDGTKIVTFMVSQGLTAGHWNSSTSFNSWPLLQTNSGNTAVTTQIVGPKWMAIQNDNTNINFLWSMDGPKGHIRQFYSEAKGSFLGAVTRVGLSAYVDGGDIEVAAPSWKCQ